MLIIIIIIIIINTYFSCHSVVLLPSNFTKSLKKAEVQMINIHIYLDISKGFFTVTYWQHCCKEPITVNTVVFSYLKIKYSKSLYVGSDFTENSHDAKGITVIYCKGNLHYYTG